MADHAAEHKMSNEDFSAAVAGGKILNHLMSADSTVYAFQESIYDAAIVMPQIARSAGWSASLTQQAMRSYMFLVGNLLFQGFILYLIAQEEEVLDRFSGQMNLCNFGANIQTCPDGPNCIGPGGTNYQDAGRMYGYTQWSLHNFAKDALMQVFPEKAEHINKVVDPGEYGVENFYVRYICIFIFMMTVANDLQGTAEMICILYYTPSENGLWLSYDVPEWNDKDSIKEVMGKNELDFVNIKISGMSWRWKILNVLCIILPKLFLWKKTSTYGVTFLMDTAGIEDVIVNVTALTFILNIDEMMFNTFCHKAVHHVLRQLQPLDTRAAGHDSLENESFDLTYSKLVADRSRPWSFMEMLPLRFLFNIFLTVIFVSEYYAAKCEYSPRGGLVSKTMALPKSQVFSWLQFVGLRWRMAEEDTPYWTYSQ